MSEPARTALYSWHTDQQARMVDFAGWLMPIQYTSIVDEHVATRERVTLFDVSHMGRLRFDGAAAARFLDRILTRPVLSLKEGQIRYSLVCNESGGVLDDVLIYRVGGDDPHYMLVVNASNRLKILDWIQTHRGDDQIGLSDLTPDTVMIAVQGPLAIAAAADLLSHDVASMKYYTIAGTTVKSADRKCHGLVSRTGYTGEDGCELVVAAADGRAVWEALMAQGAEQISAAGLGARDTLRLEAGMPLYGHELDERTTPLEAGLDFAVRLTDDRDFIGQPALETARENGPTRARIGLAMEGKRVPREGFPVCRQGEQVGVVTSGTFSPTLQQPIAMAYVETGAAQHASYDVDIRGKLAPADAAALPFYKRPK
ncbi:MAG: glycine cleavage system aminomethyltransferase GcvT [Pirellulaceae bacterium]|jgi:aminomethyltransferase|nr:glycine cleavage system aminomethyltransferase GcvT [Pirellulaceae bacterium]